MKPKSLSRRWNCEPCNLKRKSLIVNATGGCLLRRDSEAKVKLFSSVQSKPIQLPCHWLLWWKWLLCRIAACRFEFMEATRCDFWRLQITNLLEEFVILAAQARGCVGRNSVSLLAASTRALPTKETQTLGNREEDNIPLLTKTKLQTTGLPLTLKKLEILPQ